MKNNPYKFKLFYEIDYYSQQDILQNGELNNNELNAILYNNDILSKKYNLMILEACCYFNNFNAYKLIFLNINDFVEYSLISCLIKNKNFKYFIWTLHYCLHNKDKKIIFNKFIQLCENNIIDYLHYNSVLESLLYTNKYLNITKKNCNNLIIDKISKYCNLDIIYWFNKNNIFEFENYDKIIYECMTDTTKNMCHNILFCFRSKK